MRAMTRLISASLALFCSLALGLARQAVIPSNSAKLLNPVDLNETAPDTYQTEFITTKGRFVIQVTRAWAPNAADRFYNLVKNGYYDNCRFFRVLPGYAVQWGIHGDPKINAVLSKATILDDPVKQSNRKGYVSFVYTGPNSRTAQLFINLRDNVSLDAQGYAPFGMLIKGTNIPNEFFAGYLDAPPMGQGPDQDRIHFEGNAYLSKFFPKLDYIKSAVIVEEQKKF